MLNSTQTILRELDQHTTLAPYVVRDTRTAVKTLARGLNRPSADLTVSELVALDSSAIQAALARGRPAASPKTLANYAALTHSLRERLGVVILPGIDDVVRKLTVDERRPPRYTVATFTLPAASQASLAVVLTQIGLYKTAALGGNAQQRKHVWRPTSERGSLGSLRAALLAVAAYRASNDQPLPVDACEWVSVLTDPDELLAGILHRLRWTESIAQQREPTGVVVNRGTSTLHKSLVLCGPICQEFVPDCYPAFAKRAKRALPRLAEVRRRLRQLKLQSRQAPLKPDVSEITPHDLWTVGTRVVALIESGRYQTHSATTPLLYARLGVILALCAEFPLRRHNWATLTWKNLTRGANGRWKLKLSSHELKNAIQEGGMSKITHEFSVGASELIDRWREIVERELGPTALGKAYTAFTNRWRPAPNVAADRSAADQITVGIRALWIWATGRDELQAHSVRRIVASYLIRWGIENGVDGIALAAYALGDTHQTVLRAYYRPDRTPFQRYARELTTPATRTPAVTPLTGERKLPHA